MLRDDDEFDEPGYTCPVCRRSFNSFSSLDDHMLQHEGPQKCRQCGEIIRGPYHRCR